MIASQARATAWKWIAGALGIVAAIAIVLALMFRGDALVADLRAAEVEAERDDLRYQIADLKAAAKRDEASTDATNAARQAAADREPQQQERAKRVESLTRDRIVEVPGVCPVPDPDLMHELKEGSARIHRAEDRLRSIRSTDGKAAR